MAGDAPVLTLPKNLKENTPLCPGAILTINVQSVPIPITSKADWYIPLPETCRISKSEGDILSTDSESTTGIRISLEGLFAAMNAGTSKGEFAVGRAALSLSIGYSGVENVAVTGIVFPNR